MGVYETRTGKRKRDVYFKQPNKPDPEEIGFDVDESNVFVCITSSSKAGYIASCVNGTKYVNDNNEVCSWLVCHDLDTYEYLGSAVSYYYMQMSTSQV